MINSVSEKIKIENSLQRSHATGYYFQYIDVVLYWFVQRYDTNCIIGYSKTEQFCMFVEYVKNMHVIIPK